MFTNKSLGLGFFSMFHQLIIFLEDSYGTKTTLALCQLPLNRLIGIKTLNLNKEQHQHLFCGNGNNDQVEAPLRNSIIISNVFL